MYKNYHFESESNEQESEGYHSSTQHRPHKQQQCPLIRLIQAYNEIYKEKRWMVAISEANEKIDNKVIGQIYVINGLAQSGKTSIVYWALRNDKDQTAIVTVDCSLFRTELQFIQKLTKEVGQKIGIMGLDKRAVASQNIKFAELNSAIKQKRRRIVIIIRHAQRLVEYRKQLLLYNLCEWFATDIKQYIGIVFTTRLLNFVDRLEKRVSSRLQANRITLFRPSPEKILQIFTRRVECLVQQQRQSGKRGVALEAYEKIYRAMRQNRQLLESIKRNQQLAQKDIVFYLNAMKLVFSDFQCIQEILDASQKQLKRMLNDKFMQSFQAIFPYIPKNLLKTCNIPEYIVIAIIYYMGAHKRTPYRFKTVYEVYLEFKASLITSQGSGSSFIYSKNVLQRAVLNLQELNLLELDNKDESVWNCDIHCSLHPQDIKASMTDIVGLPSFIRSILGLL